MMRCSRDASAQATPDAPISTRARMSHEGDGPGSKLVEIGGDEDRPDDLADRARIGRVSCSVPVAERMPRQVRARRGGVGQRRWPAAPGRS